MDIIYGKQALILKEAKQAYKKLLASDEDPMKSLCMIDIIQRLGIEHHFVEEIEEALEKQHKMLSSDPIDFVNSHQLYEVALTFRLLRQGRHYVKLDLFDSLMCNKRNFRDKFGEDVKSLISMYEASQLSIEGEDDLDDIGHLSSELLHAWLSSHQYHSEAIYVANTLQYPLHYGLSRLMDKTIFLRCLKGNNEWTGLEELAKINSSIVRFMNQNEIVEVSKWKLAGTEALPDFMKICLSFTYKITNDFAEKIYKKHGLNPIDTLKKSWIQCLKSMLKEAHWLNSSRLPKADEYLNNGIVSSGVHVVLIHSFFLFDHIQDVTKEDIAILDDGFPNIMYSVAKILRLSDDLEGDMSLDQNGLDGSYLDCYINEHQDITTEEAQRHVANMISNEWKRLNQEIITPNAIFPSSFTKFCLNAAKMVPLMYHYKSNPSISNLKELVKSLVNVN